MNYEYERFLAHYGVKGQKWGRRQWQNEDGSYTDAGRERYWGGGHGRQPRQSMTSSLQEKNAKRANQKTLTPRQIEEQKEARKQKRNRILAIAGGVALTALAAYGVYKGSTKLRNKARENIWKRDYFDEIRNNKLKKHYSDESYTQYVKSMADIASRKADSMTRRKAVADFMKNSGLKLKKKLLR